MPENTLEPISPRDAYDWYLDAQTQEYSTNTIYAHKSRLGHFLRWCDQTGIDNMNQIDGRKVERYKTWRQREGGLNKVSLRTQTSTLKVFLSWCASIDAVHPHVAENVRVPSVSKREKKRTKDADPEQILAALDYLRKFHYATNKHVALTLLWETAMRTGGLHSLDFGDYYPRKAYLKLKHRPETGTTLKNGESGERPVALNDRTCNLLDDYLENTREPTQDKYGRDPLITTSFGRAAKGTIRMWTYKYTQPCRIGLECPGGRNPDVCEARQEHEQCATCPYNYHPHALRGASITHHLNDGWPVNNLSERVDASPEVINDHYDEPTDGDRLDRQWRFMDEHS
ncbi:site-specific integrase [Haladaptatus sp. DJG-WS-42]|uniref:tyrosine-type recombinase/integrase n=1 Tax=Haladaptatus sp. DJG-WS-42 TaxID=3120516 RepID=UPI0030D09130